MITKLLLKPEMFKPTCPKWKVDGVLNPGAIRLPNKKIMLMVRVAESCKELKGEELCPMIVGKSRYLNFSRKKGKFKDSKGKTHYLIYSECKLPNISHFRKVILDEKGMKVEKVSEKPDFVPRPRTSEYGIEDPRIVRINQDYLMSYVSISSINGVYSTLAVSEDLENWKRKGIIFEEQNKDVVLFPEKIKGKYVCLNRPEATIAFSRPDIWISYSPDLIYWGKGKNILRFRKNSWEEVRNGAGCPPIKTKKGWLLIYHGVKRNGNGWIYSVGAALLDLKNPEKVLARTPAKKPLISPAKKYERAGYMSNVVFPTGIVEDLNGKDVLIYSGGADSVITVRKISIEKIIKSLEKCD